MYIAHYYCNLWLINNFIKSKDFSTFKVVAESKNLDGLFYMCMFIILRRCSHQSTIAKSEVLSYI